MGENGTFVKLIFKSLRSGTEVSMPPEKLSYVPYVLNYYTDVIIGIKMINIDDSKSKIKIRTKTLR